MGDTPVDLGPQARVVARLAAAVRDDQLALPTPCPDYTVRELLGHVVGLAAGLRAAGRKETEGAGTAPGATLPELGPDWRAALPAALDELVATWREPAAWEGMTRAGGLDLPGAVAGLVTADELVVHGWDLARATGQEYAPDEAALRAARDLLTPAGRVEDGERVEGGEDGKDSELGGGDGLFGPIVPVPGGAPLLDRVIGLAGRDPAWTP